VKRCAVSSGEGRFGLRCFWGRLDSTGRDEGDVACRGGQEASLNTWQKTLHGNNTFAMAA